MSDYHEPVAELSQKSRSITRALNSLKEEVEAVDWYSQRVDVEKDESLKAILKHNMIEEIEHAKYDTRMVASQHGRLGRSSEDFPF